MAAQYRVVENAAQSRPRLSVLLPCIGMIGSEGVCQGSVLWIFRAVEGSSSRSGPL